MTTSTFTLEFHPVGTVPDASLEDRDFVLYNQCDGYHIVDAEFLDDGEFNGFYERMPLRDIEWTVDEYRAWAVLPDCNDTMYPLFARAGEDS